MTGGLCLGDRRETRVLLPEAGGGRHLRRQCLGRVRGLGPRLAMDLYGGTSESFFQTNDLYFRCRLDLNVLPRYYSTLINPEFSFPVFSLFRCLSSRRFAAAALRARTSCPGTLAGCDTGSSMLRFRGDRSFVGRFGSISSKR